jgi:hypothetical protein
MLLFVAGFWLGLLFDPEDEAGALLSNVMFSPIYSALQPYPKKSNQIKAYFASTLT